MKRLKVKLFLQRYRSIVYIIWGIIFITIIGHLINGMQFNAIIENQALFGVLGTLMGAIIGGTFSFLGSVFVNLRQQHTEQSMERKNAIYIPLYDELVNIQNNILKQNPYPTFISFRKGSQTILPHPQYAVWQSIKLESRYLQVPVILIRQMEKLEVSIRDYQDIRNSANEKMKEILNAVLVENNQPKSPIINIGDVISRDILENEDSDIYERTIGMASEISIEDTVRRKINSEVYENCNHSEEVKKVRACHEQWVSVQQETIELLELLIKLILQKIDHPF